MNEQKANNPNPQPQQPQRRLPGTVRALLAKEKQFRDNAARWQAEGTPESLERAAKALEKAEAAHKAAMGHMPKPKTNAPPNRQAANRFKPKPF
jgi:hypothetical protein